MRKFIPKIFFLSTLLFTVAFNFSDNPPSNWYQQFLPITGSQQINDMTFLDSLTGFIVTSRNVNPDTATIFKTTNGGDNWNVVYNHTPARLSRVQFINNTTGFVCGKGGPDGFPVLYKTTNAGINWVLIDFDLGNIYYDDMFVLNADTIWLVDKNSFNGGVYRTTNGGVNWQNQYSTGSQNPDKIYFFNARIGFIAENGGTRYVSKTINGGVNWTQIVTNDYFNDIYFADSLTGWKCSVFGMKKTTNGGLNWATQSMPSGGVIQNAFIYSFSNLNKDTIWGTGGGAVYPNMQFRGLLLRTTNGGDNWYAQVPDTNINIAGYSFINFINKRQGWVYDNLSTGIHTTNGGDTSFLTAIRYTNGQWINSFKLNQNYPNPFNPATHISYELQTSDFVTLKVFNLNGKEITTLVNKKQSAGTYTVSFDANKYNLSSGIYFYTLQTDNFKETKKMMLVK